LARLVSFHHASGWRASIDLVFALTLPVTFAAYDTCRLRKAFDWEAVAEKSLKLLCPSSEGNNQLLHRMVLISKL
jgi:hypothetical protein